jgi:hypothetical protein
MKEKCMITISESRYIAKQNQFNAADGDDDVIS